MVSFTIATIMQVLPILTKHSQLIINNCQLQMPKRLGTRRCQALLKYRCKLTV